MYLCFLKYFHTFIKYANFIHVYLRKINNENIYFRLLLWYTESNKIQFQIEDKYYNLQYCGEIFCNNKIRYIFKLYNS